MEKVYKILFIIGIVWIVLVSFMFLVSIQKGYELTKIEVIRVTGKEPSFIYIFGILLLGWFSFTVIPMILIIIALINWRRYAKKK